MATFEIAIDDTKIQDLLQGKKGSESLLGPILSQILDVEMTCVLGLTIRRSIADPTGTDRTRGS